MDFEDQIELVKEYIEETLEFLDEFGASLLQLEQMAGAEPASGLLGEILGQLHTFKGNSGMMGFSSLQKYAHVLEDFFKAIQSGNIELNDDSVEVFMESEDVLRKAVSDIKPENPSDPDIGVEIAVLERFLEENVQAAVSSPSPSSSARDEVNPFAKKTNVLKVDFERLDQLMNLMGELVIYRTRLGRVDTEVMETLGEKGVSLELSDTTEQIGKITTELHEAIMMVRMLSLRHVFMRFPRLVRDLALEKGKEINIQLEGEETELDKTVIDEIGEPLLHLIRNAIDHGIEKPEEREAVGKPRQGNIVIRAYQESSHIIITVEDDGRGIDEEKVREKVEQSGLIPKEELAHRDLMDLLFIPGLSTADAVTEVSGRGLGMGVVKKSLGKISGTVEMESEKNVGSRFTIKLPLTLAIISALMVEVSGEQYAIPLAGVVESMKIKTEDIHEVNGREVTNIRDRILPLMRLSGLFGLPGHTNGRSIYTVIVQSAIGQMGIIVDSLMGRQEIVIKALDDYIGDSNGIAGATILGDGRVVLIVDILEVMEKVRGLGGNINVMEAENA